MAVELATAYVSIIPSTKGIKGQLQDQMGKPLEQAGREGGSKFGAAVTGMAGKALKVGAGAVIGGFGAALFKGFGRLQAIDDARFKLQGLGHDAATVDTIMGSALDSVKGTAFGLGDAATIAASAVAAGVEPGKDLTRTLSLTGDAASIAGVSLAEMGAIFGKVGASNRMMTEEMNQLQDRGLPVLSWLQDEYGITADAAREMVSKGEVDFATFQKMIETNIGGAALTAGESFRGSFANMGAALGRFGAALLGPVFGSAPEVFGKITSALDVLGNKAGPLAEKVGVWLTGAFGTARSAAQGLFDLFVKGDFTGALREAFGWEEDFPIVGAILRARSAVQGLFDLIVKGDFTGALREAFGWEEDFPIVGALLTLRQTVSDVVSSVIGWFKSFGQSSSENSAWVAETFAQVVSSLRSAFDAIVSIVAWGVDVVTQFWDRFGTHILSFWSRTWDNIKGVLSGVLDVIQGVFEVFAGVFSGDWKRAWEGVKQIFKGVWDAIVGVVKIAIDLVRTTIGAATAAISQIWSTVWDRIKQTLSSAWDTIVTEVRTALDTVTRFFSDLPGKIVGALGNMGSLLYQKGRDLIQGLINGAGSLLRNIGKFFLKLVPRWIRKPFEKALGISSPSKVFADYGHNLAEGLASGMQGSGRLVEVAARDLAGMAQAEVGPMLAGSRTVRSSAVHAYQAASAVPIQIVLPDGRVLFETVQLSEGRYLARNAL